MAKDDFKLHRRQVAAKHNPPLVHVSDAATILGKSIEAAQWTLKYYELQRYYLGKPFSRGAYYAKADVEQLAERLAQKQLR